MLQRIRGQGRKIIGAVVTGGGVVVGAHALQVAVDAVAAGLVEVLAALEHQVFEQMGAAGAAGDLIARAHPVGHHESQRWAGMLGQQHHLQAGITASRVNNHSRLFINHH